MEEQLTKEQGEIKRKIEKNSITPLLIAKRIIDGNISEDQAEKWLKDAGKADSISKLQEELAKLREAQRADDDNCWNDTKSYLESEGDFSFKIAKEKLDNYKNNYPNGFHAKDCKEELANLDEKLWKITKDALQNKDENHEVKNYSEEKFEAYLKEFINDYLAVFPEGEHAKECQDYLNDMDWLITVHIHSITRYENYMEKHPGKHDKEAMEAILDIRDDIEWQNVCIQKNWKAKRESAQVYLEKFRQKLINGKHRTQAEAIIDGNGPDPITLRDQIIMNLSENPNFYPAIGDREEKIFGLKEYVEDHVLMWKDLEEVFDKEQVKAIKSYEKTFDLKPGTPPKELKAGPTEVYFWGMPSTGKTCALGAILSAANKYGIYSGRPTPGNGGLYRDQLSYLFQTEGICGFPSGTPSDSIQQMVFTLRDKNRKKHLVNFIDLAGELFRTIYIKRNNEPLWKDWQDEKNKNHIKVVALDLTEGYLNNISQKKIHFFIVAYGDEGKSWDGVPMGSYLDCAAEYLNEHKIIKKGTEGVYVLVTKSDMMPCKVEERKDFAEKYIKNHLNSFYENLSGICEEAGVKDLDIMPFSVGDVFAQQLCRFKYENTEKVLNKLILKTRVKKFWDFLNF